MVLDKDVLIEFNDIYWKPVFTVWYTENRNYGFKCVLIS